jgi:uncharacterized protein YggE
MKKYLILIALIPLMIFGQTSNQDKLITVVGFADLEIEPDIIVLGMSAKETENSKKESSTVIMENNISQFLKSIGINPSNFTLDRFNANTQYSFTSATKFKLNKFYKITVDKVNLLDTIIVKCLEYGMDNIYVQRIDHSKIDSLQNVLLVNALKSAKNKAQIIADNINVKLGKVSSVNESFKIVGSKNDYYNYLNNDFRLEDVVIGYGNESKSRIGSTISIEKLDLSKTIIVKFEIQ